MSTPSNFSIPALQDSQSKRLLPPSLPCSSSPLNASTHAKSPNQNTPAPDVPYSSKFQQRRSIPPSFMESRSSSSSPQRLFSPTQPFSDRILRALHHRLRLLHRSHGSFFILGQTGNVYTVTLSSAPSCSCPDRTNPCKHILFVFLRVLRLSLDDPCLRRRTLRPCQLARLLGSPVSPDTLARRRARERFHQLLAAEAEPACKVDEGDTCPVCMEEMKKEERLVACSVCENSVHEECLAAWKRSRGRRAASCVVCRAKWRERKEQEAYMNLAAYVSDEDGVEPEEERRRSRSCRAP
ncbi:hypothetical protein ACLOJK_021127 [Asimina triloba]